MSEWRNPDQCGLQGIVDDTQFALCSVVQSLDQALLGFFPVTQLCLCQGNIVENLRAHTNDKLEPNDVLIVPTFFFTKY